MTTYEEWRRDNWNRAHKEGDISALTGTSLGGHLAVLHAQGLFSDDTALLCIGAGTGSWVVEAAKKVKEVWCLDISPNAGKNLSQSVQFRTNSKELPSNYFDLALSLWVAPHMSNHDLQEQIAEVVRSLKPDGVFAIHYKEPLKNDSTVDNREGADDEWKVARAAEMFRRRGHFQNMVHWSGGRAKIVGEQPSHYHQMIEVSAHITKRG